MALVGYSDSESSDGEAVPAPKASIPNKSNKPAFEKLIDPTSGPRKIKVELPSVAAAPQPEAERPVKRAKTGGGFSGFNSLLPAPKRTADVTKRSGLKSGVSLKTSSVAAFSREPVEDIPPTTSVDQGEESRSTDRSDAQSVNSKEDGAPQEDVKTVANPTRFKPLSVANKKKPKKSAPTMPANDAAVPQGKQIQPASSAVVAPAKPKVSLFSVAAEPELPEIEDEGHGEYGGGTIAQSEIEDSEPAMSYLDQNGGPSRTQDPNSLGTIASDLNLSASDRRRLFGRGGQGMEALSLTNFNMDREYAKYEELRAAGETVQHRAVRAVAPGKHSLKQLVNAASSQREALEDAWAEGKRNRGEAGNKYGWGR